MPFVAGCACTQTSTEYHDNRGYEENDSSTDCDSYRHSNKIANTPVKLSVIVLTVVHYQIVKIGIAAYMKRVG
jgi:hypothetical protein